MCAIPSTFIAVRSKYVAQAVQPLPQKLLNCSGGLREPEPSSNLLVTMKIMN